MEFRMQKDLSRIGKARQFPGSLMVRFSPVFQVQALAWGELRACRPLGERKKKEKEKRIEKAITSSLCPGPPRYS